MQAGIQGDSSSGGGSPGLAEALRLVQAQLRGVITSEEQQLRLMTQERQQRRAQQKAAGVNGNGHSRGKVGRADAGGEVEAAEEEAAGDDDDDAAGAAEEAALRSSAVKALHAALESLEVVGDELLEAQAQVGRQAAPLGEGWLACTLGSPVRLCWHCFLQVNNSSIGVTIDAPC